MSKSLKAMLAKKHSDAMSAEIITEVTYIDTGIPTLNYVICGKPLTGGMPLTGKTIIMYGGEGCGKTSYVLHMIAQAQKKNVEVVYIDTERSITKPRCKQFGVDIDKLIYLNPETMEEVFSIIEDVCREKIDSGQTDPKEYPTIIIWDSLAATTTAEEDSRTTDQLEIATQAKVLTRNMRKIKHKASRAGVGLLFIQQARENQDRFGDTIAMPGGKALKHGVDVILRVSALKPDETGQGVKISVPRKNRLFKPFQNTVVRFDYVYGFTPENIMDSFCEFLKAIGILGQAGSYCYLQTEVEKIMAAEGLDEKDAIKKTSKFYRKDFSKRLIEDKEYYDIILAEAEEYVNKNINLVAKVMSDSEIDIERATQEIINDEIEEKEYLSKEDDED